MRVPAGSRVGSGSDRLVLVGLVHSSGSSSTTVLSAAWTSSANTEAPVRVQGPLWEGRGRSPAPLWERKALVVAAHPVAHSAAGVNRIQDRVDAALEALEDAVRLVLS